MTFNELANLLPNGFHDAELQRIGMDYVQRELQFDLVVWICASDDPRIRELYRPARVIVRDVAYLVVEPPDPKYPWTTPGSVTIDSGEGVPRQSTGELPTAPSGTSVTWMYLGELNRFLFFAAGSASLEWTGPEENRTGPEF